VQLTPIPRLPAEAGLFGSSVGQVQLSGTRQGGHDRASRQLRIKYA
jgi:hypothetical protein